MFDDLAGELDLGDRWRLVSMICSRLPSEFLTRFVMLMHLAHEFTSTAIVTRLSSHEMFMSVVTKIAIAFDGRWNSETRDRLVDDIAHKIPDLDSGYFLKHMIRSVSYVSGLDAIPCRDKYFKMSRHNSDAIQMLENAKWKPSDIIDYMRGDSDGLGVVDERTLVNDDMVLELVICQTKSIWDAINFGKSSVYDLADLADYDACKGIYWYMAVDHWRW